MEVLIIGAGIGGLTLGLMLYRAGIACRVFEAAPELKAVGVGINMLPHASRELCGLGLEDALAKVAVTTREYCFYNRFGQFIYSEPAGRFAGYDVPQFSIHRGDLQMVLLEAFIARAGKDKVVLGHKCTRVDYDGPEAVAYFEDVNGKPLPPVKGSVVVSAEGIHSVLRKQLYPNEGPPKYSGVNMWRGVTRWKPILVRRQHDAGGLAVARQDGDLSDPHTSMPTAGSSSTGWPRSRRRPTRARLEPAPARSSDFHRRLRRLAFRLARCAGVHSRRRPRAGISDGRPGSAAALELRPRDAARRCRPSDGSARLQRRGRRRSSMRARSSDALLEHADPVAALAAYESSGCRRPREVVLTNRTNSARRDPARSFRRTGDKPFSDIDDVISREELVALSEGYKRMAGYDKERLKAPA